MINIHYFYRNIQNIFYQMNNYGIINYNKFLIILINIKKDLLNQIKIKIFNNQVIGYKNNNKLIKLNKK